MKNGTGEGADGGEQEHATLTSALGADDIGTRLESEQQATLLCARIDAGKRFPTLAVSATVREAERSGERTGDRRRVHWYMHFH